jgi:hypothetical protein
MLTFFKLFHKAIYHLRTFVFVNVHQTIHMKTYHLLHCIRGHRGRDRIAVGFLTTCAISAYHHWSCAFESRSGEVYSIQHYMIKFASDLRQVGGFLRVLRFPPPIKTDCHDITEMLLKVALNTTIITLTLLYQVLVPVVINKNATLTQDLQKKCIRLSVSVLIRYAPL